MDYNGQTFRGVTVELDGNKFIECMFDNVVFQYGGGPVVITGCTFSQPPRWHMVGDLGRGFETIRSFAHDAGPKVVKSVVDGFSAALRARQPTRTFSVD